MRYCDRGHEMGRLPVRFSGLPGSPAGFLRPMSNVSSSAALSSSVLLLNRQYVAIHVVDVRRAFVLLFRQLAEVIHIEGDQWANYDFETWREISEMHSRFKEPHQDWVQSVPFELQVPRVLRLLHYDRVPKQVVRFNRRNIFAGKCPVRDVQGYLSPTKPFQF